MAKVTKYHVYKDGDSTLSRQYYAGSSSWTFDSDGAELYDTRQQAQDATTDQGARIGQTIVDKD